MARSVCLGAAVVAAFLGVAGARAAADDAGAPAATQPAATQPAAFSAVDLEAIAHRLRSLIQGQRAEPEPRGETWRDALSRADREGVDPTETVLRLAVVQAYLEGDGAQAGAYHARLQESLASAAAVATTQPATQPAATQPAASVEAFVVNEFFALSGAQVAPQVQIETLLRRAWLQGFGADRPDAARRFLALAEHAHGDWARRREAEPAGAAGTDVPEYEDLLLESFLAVMRQRQTAIAARARVWQSAPPELRQETYDRLKESLHAQADEAGLNGAKLFAEPVGMEAYRRSAAAQP